MTREELLVNAKPILFNTEMVQAILCGDKTVTRRLIKTELPEFLGFGYDWVSNDKAVFGFSKYGHLEAFKPKYQVGDILYVRETWKKYEKMIGTGRECHLKSFIGYKANENIKVPSEFFESKWKPSIHMPKEASRLFLKVTNVRVGRLQEMNLIDIEKEGVYYNLQYGNKYANSQAMLLHFIRLWNSTIKKQDLDKYGWEASPYVWVIEFETVNLDA